MALTDITRREVEKAIEECDRLGRDAFLDLYRFGRARRYLLSYGGREYDSKAIVGAAHGFLPGRRALTAADFSGGAAHAAGLLRTLGFEVTEQPPAAGPTADELLHRVTHPKVNRSSGHPALYQPITLLWAMGRAARGEPRLLAWSATEKALAALLTRHGMRGERPRPDYPVAALHRVGIWTLHGHTGPGPSAHGDAAVRHWFTGNQPVGGLAEPLYELFRDSEVTRLAVIDELVGTFFDGLDHTPLLADVGLAGLETPGVTGPTAAEPEPWLITAAEYERGCRLIEQREAEAGRDRVRRTTLSPKRSLTARRLVLGRSEGRCENPRCTGQPADVTDRRHPILEVDHVVELADGGRDHPSQMVALCPNCHAVKTRGSTRETLRGILLRVAAERHAGVPTRAQDIPPAEASPGSGASDRAAAPPGPHGPR
ncbi:HNH endonuclease [Streptomyces sp. e14]|uniref:HNH endonuclease n=1 Tax=Streptomyces sp. e14 TaxID=645465 RepID=UPI0002EEBCDC|nr:HNH endonuclease signature motif containing protein [Streptomyces sp. e14]